MKVTIFTIVGEVLQVSGHQELNNAFGSELKALRDERNKYFDALNEINTLRGSTLNFGVARAIACKALGIAHTDSSEPANEVIIGKGE